MHLIKYNKYQSNYYFSDNKKNYLLINYNLNLKIDFIFYAYMLFRKLYI